MESMSRPRARIACFVIPFVLAACRFELPEPEQEQVEIDANMGRSCGNGIHEPDQGEVCDRGADAEDCDADCTLPACGDGHVNPLYIPPDRVEPAEECDKGDANSDTKPDGCRTNCRKAYCRDGVKDKTEECDGLSGCASPHELCWPDCECRPGTPPPSLHGDAGR